MKIAEARRRQQEAFEAAKQKYLEEKKIVIFKIVSNCYLIIKKERRAIGTKKS